MPIVEKSGIVHATAPTVYVALTDFASAKTWLSGVEDSKTLTPGPVGKGTRFTQRRVTMGRAANVEGLVMEHDAPWSLVLDIQRDGKPAGVVTWSLATEGAATRVTCHVDFQLPGLMKIMTPMVKGTIAKQTEGDIAALDKKLRSP